MKKSKQLKQVKFTVENLNQIYSSLDKVKICQLICDVFSRFEEQVQNIENQIANRDIFLSSLGILNSFDHYAQFYKGIMLNKNENVKCDKKELNCKVCFHGISYKCRAGGNREKSNNWHYSENSQWEMATFGEGYKNFLKNTGVAKDKQSAIYNLRNEVDHQGFWNNKITIQHNKLLFNDDDLLDLLKNSLNNFRQELYKELEKQDFRVDKSFRVIRFLDHLFYIKPDQFISTNKKS